MIKGKSNIADLIAEEQPCVAYFEGKIYAIFKTRGDCARHFSKSSSGCISSAIARKGRIKYNGKRYAIRNYSAKLLTND